MSDYAKLLPQPTADTQPYWDGLNDASASPAALCRLRQGAPLSASGLRCLLLDARRVDRRLGTRRSCTVGPSTHHAFHPGFKPDLPYTLLTVDLDEGVRMNAQLRGLDPAGAAHRPAGAGGLRTGDRRPDIAGIRSGKLTRAAGSIG